MPSIRCRFELVDIPVVPERPDVRRHVILDHTERVGYTFGPMGELAEMRLDQALARPFPAAHLAEHAVPSPGRYRSTMLALGRPVAEAVG